jgi:hypothetical protein
MTNPQGTPGGDRASPATDLQHAGAVIDALDRAAEALIHSPHRARSVVRLPQRGRLLATGDLHDNPSHLEKIIRLAQLDRSRDHHVVLHEMIHGERLINGLDFSYRMLARTAALVARFPEQVHPILANHELAQLTGRGVSKGAGDGVALFIAALEYVFGDEAGAVNAAVSRFIRAMPIAVMTASGVMCSHSLPAPVVMSRFDLGLVERDLTDADYQAPHGAAYLMVWGRRHDPAQLEALAGQWNVRLFCIGHEHAETGLEVRHEKLVVLNSDHEFGSVLPLDLTGPPPLAEDAALAAIPLRAIGDGP